MNPEFTEYDFGLGISPDIVQYVKESNAVESRIGSVKCYLYFREASGSVTGSSSNPITATNFLNYPNNYATTIWTAGSEGYPDIRPYMNNIVVLINSTPAVRILAASDLQNNNEFAVVERKDLAPATVEVWFNSGFNPSGSVIQYYYSTVEPGINDIRFKRGEGQDQELFGWTQYLNAYRDPFVGPNQILVRLPITPETLVINEEGRVKLKANDSWMIGEPYVNNYDLIIVPASYTFSGQVNIFEIIEKRDSVIQGVLTSQRFKLNLLDYSDHRYNLPIITS